jgi:hypothetical protein
MGLFLSPNWNGAHFGFFASSQTQPPLDLPHAAFGKVKLSSKKSLFPQSTLVLTP